MVFCWVMMEKKRGGGRRFGRRKVGVERVDG
jgi:hypothetical protein